MKDNQANGDSSNTSELSSLPGESCREAVATREIPSASALNGPPMLPNHSMAHWPKREWPGDS